MINIKTIEELSIGMVETYEKIITESDVEAFANLSGDHNPVHLDENFAKKTIFKKRIAHGLMSASFFSGIFGMKLPGYGSIYVSQSLRFSKPVYIGDKVIAKVEITKIDILKSRVFFKTSCSVEGKKVIDGEAEIYILPIQDM